MSHGVQCVRCRVSYLYLFPLSPVPCPLSPVPFPPLKNVTLKVCIQWSRMYSMSCLTSTCSHRPRSLVPCPLSPPKKKMTLKVCIEWSPMCSMSCLLPLLVPTVPRSWSLVPGPLSPKKINPKGLYPMELTLKVEVHISKCCPKWVKSRPKWSFDPWIPIWRLLKQCIQGYSTIPNGCEKEQHLATSPSNHVIPSSSSPYHSPWFATHFQPEDLSCRGFCLNPFGLCKYCFVFK